MGRTREHRVYVCYMYNIIGNWIGWRESEREGEGGRERGREREGESERKDEFESSEKMCKGGEKWVISLFMFARNCMYTIYMYMYNVHDSTVHWV